MRRITGYLLWLFVFTVPWGIDAVPGIGTIARLLGTVTLAAAALTTLVEARIRKPGVVFWAALAFTISSILSLFWTIAYAATVERVGTYVQLLGIVWIVREFARTREQQYWLLATFCLGAFALAVDLLFNFITGVQYWDTRYSATGLAGYEFNPNYVAGALVIGFPMAWHLFIQRRAGFRVFASVYCLVAPLGIMLTTARGLLIAGLAALLIIPLSLRRQSFRLWAMVTILLSVVAVATTLLVPQTTWERIGTIGPELEEGTLSGRTSIWAAGWRVFHDRPIFGVGAGAFPAAVNSLIYVPRAAHNVPLALLVEQGIVGLFLFIGLLGACAWVIRGLPLSDRKLWAVLMLTWLIAAMTSDWHFDKVTWVLFGLLAAQGTVGKANHQISHRKFERVQSVAGEALPHPIHASARR